MIGSTEPPAEHGAKQASDTESPTTIRRYAVADLLQGAREAILVHDGAEYRLRVTVNGKLILTK